MHIALFNGRKLHSGTSTHRIHEQEMLQETYKLKKGDVYYIRLMNRLNKRSKLHKIESINTSSVCEPYNL